MKLDSFYRLPPDWGSGKFCDLGNPCCANVKIRCFYRLHWTVRFCRLAGNSAGIDLSNSADDAERNCEAPCNGYVANAILRGLQTSLLLKTASDTVSELPRCIQMSRQLCPRPNRIDNKGCVCYLPPANTQRPAHGPLRADFNFRSAQVPRAIRCSYPALKSFRHSRCCDQQEACLSSKTLWCTLEAVVTNSGKHLLFSAR